ncbi:hypothetical protein MUG91_G6n402 [Manis pentadactyla]|nr:hypothetical protein MUG91_G6n402 [Manis pentadactyla]
MAAAKRGGAAPSPGRSGAGPPSAESLRRRRQLGARMEELLFGPSLGDRDGPALRSWRQLGSPGVIWSLPPSPAFRPYAEPGPIGPLGSNP